MRLQGCNTCASCEQAKFPAGSITRATCPDVHSWPAPCRRCRLHLEPLSDIAFAEQTLFTSCHSGQVRCWLRPHVVEAVKKAMEQQQEEGQEGGQAQQRQGG